MKSPNSKVLTREEIAVIEVGSTAVSRRLASAITLFSMAIILSVPFFQQVADVHAYLVGERMSPWPQSLEIMSIPGKLPMSEAGSGRLHSVLKSNAFLLKQIDRYEEQLSSRSMLTTSLLGPVQELMSGRLGVGNEKAYPGRDGWLYYRPDVDYLTGPSFLDEHVQKRRAMSGEMWDSRIQPDPVEAIIDFKRQLNEYGVELVLVPVPAKPGIVSAPLAGKKADVLPIQNPAFETFRQRMDAAGVEVFDPSPILARLPGNPQEAPYLVTDTHWTPQAMEKVARELAGFLRRRYDMSVSEEPIYSRNASGLSALGDIARMLKLPSDSDLYEQEPVVVDRVFPRAGAGLPAAGSAEVLLLGDSFANIYSSETMGWGDRAGFAEQLAFYLQQPVDSFTRNDNGAYAAREILRAELSRGESPLKGKKVVVWEFAARELAFGDWKIIKLAAPERESRNGAGRDEAPGMFSVAPGQSVEVVGTVAEASPIPAPGSVPYRDHVCMVHLTQVSRKGESDSLEAVAFMLSMKDNELTEVAAWKPGQRVELHVQSWDEAADQYGTINQSALDDFLLLDSYLWAEPSASDVQRRGIPGGLVGYAAGMAALSLIACRRARGVFMLSGMGLLGAVWLAVGVFIINGSPAVEMNVIAESKDSEPAQTGSAAFHESFREWCASTAAQAEKSGDQVVRGAEDWLFLPSEVRHLGLGVFWGDKAADISKAYKPEYADPLKAILDFKTQLEQVGVDLWVLPVPPKALIYADKLTRGEYEADAQLASADQEFYSILAEHGVNVIDLTSRFITYRNANTTELYCRQDSHWASPAIELTAQELGQRIALLPWYDAVERKPYIKKTYEVELTGDLWQMLEIEKPQKERLELSLVKNKDTGMPVPVDRDSPVLVLGDSHTLVFHNGGDMHAVGAGLVDQLSYETGLAYDLIGVKGSGAGAPRRNLYATSRQNPSYLAGKKLIIWCFSAREFTEASGIAWRKIPVR